MLIAPTSASSHRFRLPGGQPAALPDVAGERGPPLALNGDFLKLRSPQERSPASASLVWLIGFDHVSGGQRQRAAVARAAPTEDHFGR